MTNPSIAKLTWRARRGMLELDIILSRFLKTHGNNLTQQQLEALERLLEFQDPILYECLMGLAIPNDKELADLVAFIQSTSKV